MRLMAAASLLAAAFALAACGGKTLDTANVEKDIQQVASQDGVETKVECPDEVDDIKEGTTYECEITYAGNEGNKQTVEMKVAENDESEFADEKAVTDEGQIRQLVAATDENPALICENVSEEMLEQLGGEECAAQAEAEADEEPAKIESIEIEGDTATMVTSKSTTTLERSEDGGWIVTAVE